MTPVKNLSAKILAILAFTTVQETNGYILQQAKSVEAKPSEFKVE